jgi:hypothetical protein
MGGARHGIGGGVSRGKGWPPEHDNLAWRMYWSGRTYDEIAERLKRTHSAVFSRIQALKHLGGPGEKSRPAPLKKRACLCCRRPFASSWIGNRVCGNCKATEAYA